VHRGVSEHPVVRRHPTLVTKCAAEIADENNQAKRHGPRRKFPTMPAQRLIEKFCCSLA
jgi:hypothetical protein